MIVLEQITSDDARYAALGDEGFTISANGDGNLYITGGQYRGCLYGVYEFLEKYVGWRFMYDYDMTVAVLQNMDTFFGCYDSYDDAVYDYLYPSDGIDIPVGTEETQTPSFAMRDVYGTPGINKVTPDKFAVKAKDNGSLRGKADYNGYGVANAACHGIVRGPAKYFPDYDYDPSKGDGQTKQPCFTNEDNISISIDYYTAQIQARLDAGQKVGREIVDIDVAIADNPYYCTCKDCMQKISYDGAYIGPVIYFTNLIADAVSEISPDIYVSMLAYSGTTTPPKKTVPRENVAVSYCYYIDIGKSNCNSHPMSGEDCMSHPRGFSYFPVSNIDYAAELSKWCEISTRVIVWLYPGTWYALPFTSSTVFNLLDDMKFLNGLGVYGIFVCPSYESASDGVIPYVLSKLFWNCDISEEEYADMIKEYCYLQYGDGWENIYEYMLIQEHIKSDACWNTFAFSDTSLRVNLEYYRDIFNYLIGLYEDAALLAQSSVQEYRILYHSLNMYYTGLVATYNSMYKNGSEAERALYLERRNSFCEQTSDVVMSCGAGGATRKYVDPFSDFDITADTPGVLSDSE